MAIDKNSSEGQNTSAHESNGSGQSKVVSNITDEATFFDDKSEPILRARDIRKFKEYKALRGIDHDNEKLVTGLRDKGALGQAFREFIAAPEDELWGVVDKLREVRKESSKCPIMSTISALTPAKAMNDAATENSHYESPFITGTDPFATPDNNLLYSEFLTYWEDFVIAPDDGTVGRKGRTVCPFSPTVGLLGTLLVKIVRHQGLAEVDETAWSQLEYFFSDIVLPRLKTEKFWEEEIGSLEVDENKAGWKNPGEDIAGTQLVDTTAPFTSKQFSKFQVMVFMFPEFTLNEAGAARLVQMRQKLKPLFVKNDLMFIPFHMHNLDRPSQGARATQSCPGRSLVPFLQIRPITAMDLPYVKPDPYALNQGFSESQMQEMEEAWQERKRKIQESQGRAPPRRKSLSIAPTVNYIKSMAKSLTSSVLRRNLTSNAIGDKVTSTTAVWGGCALTCFLSAILVTKLRNK